MERVFRLTGDLACMWEEDLPEGPLALEPRCVGSDDIGADWVFLASRDGGNTWREYRTGKTSGTGSSCWSRRGEGRKSLIRGSVTKGRVTRQAARPPIGVISHEHDPP